MHVHKWQSSVYNRQSFFFFLIKKQVKRREPVFFWKWNMKTRHMDKH